MTLATRNVIFFAITWLVSTLFLNYFIGNGDKELIAHGEGEAEAMVVMFSVVQGVAFMSVVGTVVSVLFVIASAVKKMFAIRKGKGAQ